MKSVVLGIAAMLIISAASWLVMGTQTTTSGDAFVSQNNSVRLD